MPEFLLGKFTWFELVTRKPDEGRDFYAGLIGWGTTAMPTPGGGPDYTMFQAGERTVGGVAPLGDDMPDVPHHWRAFVSVEDVAATTEAVKAGGGTVLVGPLEIPGMLTMTIAMDPQGAPFAFMRAVQGDEPDVDSYPGIFHWNELYSADLDASKTFYGNVFGWTFDEMEMPDGKYYVAKRADGVSAGGMMQRPSDELPPNWLPYVHVEEIDAVHGQALATGSTELLAPTSVPGIGRFSSFLDPGGAAIGLITPDESDGS